MDRESIITSSNLLSYSARSQFSFVRSQPLSLSAQRCVTQPLDLILLVRSVCSLCLILVEQQVGNALEDRELAPCLWAHQGPLYQHHLQATVADVDYMTIGLCCHLWAGSTQHHRISQHQQEGTCDSKASR